MHPFRAAIEARELEGCDFIQLDEDGAIKESTVRCAPVCGAGDG
jgi:uncharacterized protein YuzE